MRILVFIWTSILLTSAANAVTPIELHSAEFRSYPCNQELQQSSRIVKKGSGTLFVDDLGLLQSLGEEANAELNGEAEVYFLSSDHVAYHSNEGICHEVLNSGWESESRVLVELLHVNFNIGLALYKAPNDLREFSVPISKFLSTRAASGRSVILSGYVPNAIRPGDPRARISAPGDILSNSSQRHLLPEVREVIEVDGHVEFGMSGGGLWASPLAGQESSGSFFAGVISHQYVAIQLGQPGEVVLGESGHLDVAGNTEFLEDLESGQAKLNAIVIPSDVVLNWLENPNDARLRIENQAGADTLGEYPSFQFGEIEFRIGDCRSTQVGGAPLLSSGHGAGVGGISLLPESGHGAGVGANQTENRPCSVVVTRRDISRFPPDLPEWPYAVRPDFLDSLGLGQLGNSKTFTHLRLGDSVQELPSDLPSLFALLNVGAVLLEERQSSGLTEVQILMNEILATSASVRGRISEQVVNQESSRRLFAAISTFAGQYDLGQRVNEEQYESEILRSTAWTDIEIEVRRSDLSALRTEAEEAGEFFDEIEFRDNLVDDLRELRELLYRIYDNKAVFQ